MPFHDQGRGQQGERVRLPDGSFVRLPANISPEERNNFIRDMRARYGLEPFEPTTSPPPTAIPEPTPAPPPAIPERAPVPSATLPWEREPTKAGVVKAGLKAIPIGVQQAYYMTKQGVLGAFSPDVETEAEKKVQRDLENLILKIDPLYRESHLVQLGMGLGTMGGMFAPALVPGVGWGAALAASGMMGLGEQTSRMARHERETGEDISLTKELLGMGMGLGIGFTEMVPIGRLAKKANPVLRAFKGRGLAKSSEEIGKEILEEEVRSRGVRGIVASAARQAVEEAIQESGAGFAQSVTARALYDDDALVGAGADAFKEAILGGEVGAIADLSLGFGMRALGFKGRRRYEQYKAAGSLIEGFTEEGKAAGTITDERAFWNIVGTNPKLDDNGDETGEWEFIDQSEGAESIRESAKYDENIGMSPLRLQAGQFSAEVVKRLQQQHEEGTIDDSQLDIQLKEEKIRAAKNYGLILALENRLQTLDTGIDPGHIMPEGGTVSGFERATSEEDTGPQAKIINFARREARENPSTFTSLKNLSAAEAEVLEEAYGPGAAEVYVEEINRLQQIVEEDKQAEVIKATYEDLVAARVAEDEAKKSRLSSDGPPEVPGVPEVRAVIDPIETILTSLQSPTEPVTNEEADTLEDASTATLESTPTVSIGYLYDTIWSQLAPSRESIKGIAQAEINSQLKPSDRILTRLKNSRRHLEELSEYIKEKGEEGRKNWNQMSTEAQDWLNSIMGTRLDVRRLQAAQSTVDRLEESTIPNYERRIEILEGERGKLEKSLQEASEEDERVKLTHEIVLKQNSIEEVKLELDESTKLLIVEREVLKFGQDKPEQRKRYIRSMLEVMPTGMSRIDSQIADIEEGSPRQEIFEESDGFGGTLSSDVEIQKGTNETRDAAYLEAVRSAKEDQWFPPGTDTKTGATITPEGQQRDFSALQERLPWESQRIALRRFQELFNNNPDLELSPEEVSNYITEIFAGGLQEGYETVYDYYTKTVDAGEDAWLWSGRARIETEEEVRARLTETEPAEMTKEEREEKSLRDSVAEAERKKNEAHSEWIKLERKREEDELPALKTEARAKIPEYKTLRKAEDNYKRAVGKLRKAGYQLGTELVGISSEEKNLTIELEVATENLAEFREDPDVKARIDEQVMALRNDEQLDENDLDRRLEELVTARETAVYNLGDFRRREFTEKYPPRDTPVTSATSPEDAAEKLGIAGVRNIMVASRPAVSTVQMAKEFAKGRGGTIRVFRLKETEDEPVDPIIEPELFNEDEVERLAGKLVVLDPKTKKPKPRKNRLTPGMKGEFFEKLNTPEVALQIGDDGNYRVVSGMNIYMAAKRVGRTTIHAREVPKPRREAPTEAANNVMKAVWDLPALQSLGFFFEKHATDRGAILYPDTDFRSSKIPFTAREELIYILGQFRKHDAKVTKLMLRDALEVMGIGEVSGGKLVVGKVPKSVDGKVVEVDFVDALISNTFGEEATFDSLLNNERLLLLDRILSSPVQARQTSRQKPISERSPVIVGQGRTILEHIRNAGEDGFSVVREGEPGSQMHQLVNDLLIGWHGEVRGKEIIREYKEGQLEQYNEVMDAASNYIFSLESVLETSRDKNLSNFTVSFKSPEQQQLEAKDPPASDEEISDRITADDAARTIKEGMENEREGDGPKWNNNEEARIAEATRAKKRVDAFKEALVKRAKLLFGEERGGKIEFEVVAFADSLYADYVDRLADRGKVDESAAFLDTYTGRMVFHISMLEEQYSDSYENLDDVPIEMIASNAMLHEGTHLLFLKEMLSPRQLESLKRYGENSRVPKEVNEDAFAKNLTWREWVESQPIYRDLDAESLTEETSVQILDALAMGTIPGSKTAGGIGYIKREILDRIKMMWGVSREADLHSIMSVFNTIQDATEVSRRLDAVEKSEVGKIRYAERADPEDLRELMEAQKKGDTQKAEEIAKKIAHSRIDVVEISPSQQFINQMRARIELGQVPKGIISALNGGSVADGTITAASLNEFFNIQDGKPPYRMTGPRIRQLGRTRATVPNSDDDEILANIDARHEKEGRGKKESEQVNKKAILKALIIEGEKGEPIDEVNPKAIKKVWQYNWKMHLRRKLLDRTLPMGLSSLRAEARRKALGELGEVTSITAWKYAHNAQNFTPGIWNRGPIRHVNPDSDQFSGYTLPEDQTVVIDGVTYEAKALGDIFRPIMLDGDAGIKMAHQFGEALRVLETHDRLQAARSYAESLALGEPLPARFGGLVVNKKGHIKQVKVRQSVLKTLSGWALFQKVKARSQTAANKELTRALWEVGEWQRRFDRVLPPGPHDKSGESQQQRLDGLQQSRADIESAAEKTPDGMAAKTIKFWDEFRIFNHVMIDFAFDSDLIDAKRRDLYQSISFMPFYRDQTGWGDVSIFMNQNSPEMQDIADRQKDANNQNVSGWDAKGSPLIDKNIEGSFAPLDPDLVGNILKNVQSLIRDSMWNEAANRTTDEMVAATDLESGAPSPEAREQIFLNKMKDITEAEKNILGFTGIKENPPINPDTNEPYVFARYDESLTERQEKTIINSRGLLTRKEISDLGFEDLTIRLKKNGEYHYYRVIDAHMAEAIMAVGVSPRQTLERWFGKGGIGMSEKWATRSAKLLVGSSDLLRKAVTLSPVFWGKNVLRDSWQASVTFGHGWEISRKALKNFFNWGYFGDAPSSLERGERLGLAVGIDFRMAKEEAHENMLKLVKEENLKWDTPMDFVLNFVYFRPLRRFLKQGMAQSEIATRLAVYDVSMRETGGNEAKSFTQAMEIINFGRRGSSPIFSVITALSPFMNGRIQGLDVTWRTHIGSVDVPGLYPDDDNLVIPMEAVSPSLLLKSGERIPLPSDYSKLTRGSNWHKRAARAYARGGLIAMGTLMYYWWMWDEDEYKNAREDEKNNNWITPWGWKVPIPFEVGTIYKMIPEQIFRWLNSQEPTHDVRDVREAAKDAIYQSLGLDLRPQLFRNIWDASRNIDRFQKDNIIPRYWDESLMSSEQVRNSTSLVATGLGKTMDKIPIVNWMDWITSPMKLEYLLRQQFGTLGAYAINTADAIAAWSLGINRAGTPYNWGLTSLFNPQFGAGKMEGIHPLGTPGWNRIPLLGDLLFDPREGGGYQEDFYELIETLDHVVTTLGQMETGGRGREEDVREWKEKHEIILRNQRRLRQVETYMSDWREERDAFLERTDLSRDDETRLLIRKYEERDRVLGVLVEEVMTDIKKDRGFLESLLGRITE